MGRKTGVTAPATLTAPRAARLYKLLTLLGPGPQTRRYMLAKLKLDVRGFYRDFESLRGLGIDITAGVANKYALPMALDAALALLPFPDPGLNVRDALQLCNGTTAAHRKLRQRVNTFLQSAPNKPR